MGNREPVVCGILLIKNSLRIIVYASLAILVAMLVVYIMTSRVIKVSKSVIILATAQTKKFLVQLFSCHYELKIILRKLSVVSGRHTCIPLWGHQYRGVL